MFDIVLTANSPGEVAAWVKPVVEGLKQNFPDCRISVFLPPCVFASGNEEKVLKKYPEIDQVFNWKKYLKYIILQKKPKNFSPDKKGLVFFLGGDLFHAFILGKKLNYPVIAYTQGDYQWANHIDKFLVPDKNTQQKLLNKGASEKKVEIIGNLMLSSLSPKKTPQAMKNCFNIKKEKIITIFPGSRFSEIEFMLPFFIDSLLKYIYRKNVPKEFKFFLSQSPFITDQQLKDVFIKYKSKNDLKAEVIDKNNYQLLRINNKLEIIVLKEFNYSLMQITDLALTIPGTNNLELAYFQTPMIVVLPLNQPGKIPLRGLRGLIGRIPVLGPFIKKLLLPRLLKKRKFISLPNIIQAEEIVPELTGKLEPQDLTDNILKLINHEDRLKEMRDNFEPFTAARFISQKIKKNVNQIIDNGGK